VLHAGLIGGLGPVIIYGLAIATGGDQLTMRTLSGLALSCAGLASLVAQNGGPAARVTVLGDLIVLAGDRGVLLLHRPREANRRPVRRSHVSVVSFRVR
jgi:hypothetical protein